MKSVTEQRGFTLFELLIAVTIVSLLLSVGIPSLSTFVKNSNQITSANLVLADLTYARDLAVTRNQRIAMCPSNSGLGCDSRNWADGWIVFADTDSDGQVDAGETIERAGEALDGLSLQSAQFPAALTYRPNGNVMGAALGNNFGAFLLCDDRGADHARGIIIDFSGRPRVTPRLTELGITANCPAI